MTSGGDSEYGDGNAFKLKSSCSFSSIPYFYGRKKELETLKSAYRRISSGMSPSQRGGGRSELVLISGSPGTGKTSLAKTFGDYVNSDVSIAGTCCGSSVEKLNKGYFVSGKFDKIHQSNPYSALSTAFNQLCDRILESSTTMTTNNNAHNSCYDHNNHHHNCSREDTDNRRRICLAIRNVIGSEGGSILTNVIPNLQKILSGHHLKKRFSSASITAASTATKASSSSLSEKTTTSVDELMIGSGNLQQAMNRFRYLFRSLVRAICHQSSRPIILFLDDLQWADVASLEVLKVLVTDEESRHLLIVGSYRDDGEDEGEDDGDELSFGEEDKYNPKKNLSIEILRKIINSSGGDDGDDERRGDKLRITMIRVKNLDFHTVRQIVSDVYQFQKEEGNDKKKFHFNRVYSEAMQKTLAMVVYQETKGNIFDIIQFLMLLEERKFLNNNTTTKMWTLNLSNLQKQLRERDSNTSLGLSITVSEITAVKIRKQDEVIQNVLKTAACLGCSFDANILMEVMLSFEKKGLFRRAKMRKKERERRKSFPLWTGGQDHEKEIFSKDQHQEVEDDPEMLDYTAIFSVAIKEGIIERGSGSHYRFIHDRIHETTYRLVGDDQEREYWHLNIGNVLCRKLSSSSTSPPPSITIPPSPSSHGETVVQEEWMIFQAVDQLNLGSSLMDPWDKDRLASFNLHAGERAIALSAFGPASAYFQHGIDLLFDGDQKWDLQYDLCFQLHSALAESAYCIGNFELSKFVVDKIMFNAKCLKHKIQAYITLVHSLGAQSKLEESMQVGLDVLSQLGYRIPKKPRQNHILYEIISTKRLLRHKTDQDLLNLPNMQDESKKAAMKFLDILSMYAWLLARKEYMALFSCHMVKLSVKYGLVDLSASAFAKYGMLLGTPNIGNVSGGYRFGRLALRLLERFDTKAIQSSVRIVVYNFLHHWKDPLQASLDPLLCAHEVGMIHGDIMCAFMGAVCYCSTYYFCGMPLGPLEKDLRLYARQMVEYKQDTSLNLVLPLWQLTLNLIGGHKKGSKDMLELTGEAMNQQELLARVTKINNMKAVLTIVSSRLFLAYYFGDLELAESILAESGRLVDNFTSSFLFVEYAHFSGLVWLALARSTGKSSYKRKARHIMKKMKKWAECAAGNCLHLFLLLEAEYKSLSTSNNSNMDKSSSTILGNSSSTVRSSSNMCAGGDSIKRSYDLAITTAGRAGFTHDHALANERAGRYFHEVRNGDGYWSSYYLTNAYQLYLKWGAKAKADHLLNQYASLISTTRKCEEEEEELVAVRGRSRFTDFSKHHNKRLSLS